MKPLVTWLRTLFYCQSGHPYIHGLIKVSCLIFRLEVSRRKQAQGVWDSGAKRGNFYVPHRAPAGLCSQDHRVRHLCVFIVMVLFCCFNGLSCAWWFMINILSPADRLWWKHYLFNKPNFMKPLVTWLRTLFYCQSGHPYIHGLIKVSCLIFRLEVSRRKQAQGVWDSGAKRGNFYVPHRAPAGLCSQDQRVRNHCLYGLSYSVSMD